MTEIKNILCPSDFSEHSQAALPYAIDLARRYDAELHFLHVADDSYQYWVAGGESASPILIPEDELLETSQKQMDDFVAKHLSGVDVPLVTKLVTGRPFVEIIRYAREESIDMIVIATHGRGAIASMLLGGVTEKVVRKASCPVLTVRHADHKFEMP